MPNVHGWESVALMQRRTDGRCALVTPEQTYSFEARDARDAFEAALGASSVDQEAVDMFVGSVVANDGGRTPTGVLRARLAAAVEASSAWRKGSAEPDGRAAAL